MVAIGFLCVAFGFGSSTATMPLIYSDVMREFGWTRTETTLIFTYKNIAGAAMALFLVGPLFVRFGLRPVMVGSIIVTGLGMISFLWVHSLWTYYLSGFLLGLGAVSVLIASEALISRWFSRHQGVAIGIALAGGSVGGIIFSVLAQHLIEAFQWRMAFALMSLGLWVVALPLYLLKAREKPEYTDVRQELPPQFSSGKVRAIPVPIRINSEIGKLLRLPQFWVILLCLFVTGAVDAGVFQHTALFLGREAGFDSETVAYCLSAIFALSILGKVLAGRLFDRRSLKGVGLWFMLSALALIAALSITGAVTLIAFVVLRGISHGGTVTEPPVIAKHCYGPCLINLTLPIFAGIWALGAAFGPVALSMIYEHYGSYQQGFAAAVVLTLITGALIYRVRPTYLESIMAGREGPDPQTHHVEEEQPAAVAGQQ